MYNLKKKFNFFQYYGFGNEITQVTVRLAGIYLLKVNNKNGTRCEIHSNLTIKIPERQQWYRFDVFIFNFERISHLLLVFLLLTLGRLVPVVSRATSIGHCCSVFLWDALLITITSLNIQWESLSHSSLST